MAVILEKMSEEEYSKFYKISFETQVEELIREENLSRNDAENETKKELEEMLPLGIDTNDNFLLSIKNDDNVIGYIWFLTEYNEDIKQSFLCDFMIFEEYRGKGYAKEALVEMEKMAADMMCKESVLFVADENIIAQRLYSKCGYQVLRKHNYGQFMKKEIDLCLS